MCKIPALKWSIRHFCLGHWPACPTPFNREHALGLLIHNATVRLARTNNLCSRPVCLLYSQGVTFNCYWSFFRIIAHLGLLVCYHFVYWKCCCSHTKIIVGNIALHMSCCVLSSFQSFHSRMLRQLTGTICSRTPDLKVQFLKVAVQGRGYISSAATVRAVLS